MASGIAVLLGCERANQMSDLPTTQSPQRSGSEANVSQPLVDHPEYANWQQFPLGTVVIRQKEVSNEHGVVRVKTSLRMAEKDDTSLTVETQVTVDRSGEGLVENPPFAAKFPRQFRLPSGMNADQFALPSLKAKLVGEEVLEACGQSFETQVFAWDEVNEAGPMKVKLWWSAAMPGRMVRQEIDGHMHHSVEKVVEIRPPISR
jgi:hypothetical protein